MLSAVRCVCRQGIASKLVRRCEDAARNAQGIEAVALHVDEGNAAGRALYAACGFREITRKTSGPYARWASLLPINEHNHGLVLMVKGLHEEGRRAGRRVLGSSCPGAGGVLADAPQWRRSVCRFGDVLPSRHERSGLACLLM
jgi:Acetyltransferase (GNAT) family